MLKRWIDRLYDGTLRLRERLFYVIIVMGLSGAILALISGLIQRQSLLVILPTAGLVAGLAAVLWYTLRSRRIKVVAVFAAAFVNLVLFPIVFFISGGIEGGSAIWFVLGVMFIFLLFEGKAFYLLLAATLCADGLAYYLSYRNPEWVKPLESSFSVYFDSFTAVLITSLVIGALIKIQNSLYEREVELTEKQKEEIDAVSRSKNAFFANMSHEIRTPINTIIGLNEMILREDTSDEIAENAINIQNASKMLLALINDILDLSKLESGKMELVPTQYETGAMLSDLVNIIWIRAHEKKLEFKVDISKDIPSMLFGDEVRLKQVLANILTNAVKYTSEGSVTLTVRAKRLDNNTVRLKISVEDTGMGIKKEDIEELFHSFKRVDEEKNRQIEGSGLGLAISKQLIEMMGGTITVDSIYTKGSVFTVALEQKIVDERPLGTIDFAVKRRLYNREKYRQSFEAPGARILIVDDNEMNLTVAVKLLRATKVKIDTAKSGRECLEKTRSRFYHVIFMDHMMPEMDGVETLKLVQRQENGLCRETPVIALTANAMAGAADSYQKSGFQGYLAKPINGALFEATLLKYLPADLIEYNRDTEEEGQEGSTIRLVSGGRKKAVCITTDCVCDLPAEWLEYYHIRKMYYYVHTREGRFCDGTEITTANLLSYLKKDENRAYSAPASVPEYELFFADALKEAEQVVHISMASRSGGGYAAAVSAAGSFGNVHVIDSGNLSSGMGIMVLQAAQMARDGFGAEEIKKELARRKDRISTSFIVPSAETLYRNGKTGKAVRGLCRALQLHPVFYLSQSKIKCRSLETGRTEKAYQKYIRRSLRAKKKIDTSLLFITYAGCSVKQQQEILAEVEKHVKFDRVVFQETCATIASNCGTGAFGLLYKKNAGPKRS